LISVLFGLMGFGIVCAISLFNNEELLTCVIRSLAAFAVLWVFFNLMGVIFDRVVPTGEEEVDSIFISGQEDTTIQTEQNSFAQFESISDNDLPEIDLGGDMGKAA
jgi:hypothetical protein